MPNFIDIINLELSNFSGELHEPRLEMEEGDHDVGEITEVMVKRLFCLSQKWQHLAEQALVDARYEQDEDASRQNVAKAFELGRKADLLKQIFWTSVKDTFGLWEKSDIGVRRGWVVVWSDPEQDPIHRLFGGLGGQ